MPYRTAADAVAAKALARADRQTLAVFAAGHRASFESSGIALCRPATAIRALRLANAMTERPFRAEVISVATPRDDRHVDHLQKRLGSQLPSDSTEALCRRGWHRAQVVRFAGSRQPQLCSPRTSRASRNPSPMKLKLVTAIVIAAPGMIAIQGALARYCWAPFSILPQLGSGGWMP
jgi:hypothetical protein